MFFLLDTIPAWWLLQLGQSDEVGSGEYLEMEELALRLCFEAMTSRFLLE